jgi:hypothetical protein
MESLEPVVEVAPFEVYIGEDYKLTTDKLNVIINQKYIKKNKEGNEEEAWKQIGFYPNLEQACTRLLDKEINQAYVKDVKELLATIREAKNEIVKAVKNYSL